MGKLVAIGGGEMAERETLAIDREIVSPNWQGPPKRTLHPYRKRRLARVLAVLSGGVWSRAGLRDRRALSTRGQSDDRGARKEDSLGQPGLRRWWEYPEDDETLAKAGSGQGLERGLQGRGRPVRAERRVYLLVQLGP